MAKQTSARIATQQIYNQFAVAATILEARIAERRAALGLAPEVFIPACVFCGTPKPVGEACAACEAVR